MVEGRIKRLERDPRVEMIEIPQNDGTVRRFPQSAGMEAFMNLMDRLGAGEDAPSEHPLVGAARDSSDPKWSGSIYAGGGEGWTDSIEHLSE